MRRGGLVAGEERRQRRRRVHEGDDGHDEEKHPEDDRRCYEGSSLGDGGRVEGLLMDAVSNRQWARAGPRWQDPSMASTRTRPAILDRIRPPVDAAEAAA